LCGEAWRNEQVPASATEQQMNSRVSNVWPSIALFSLCSAMFSMSCWLMSHGVADGTWRSPTRSVADKVFGTSRMFLGNYFYFQADEQYHGGYKHKHSEAFEDTVFQKALKEVSPRKEVHMTGRAVDEMMPWLWFAIRADPHNADVYLVTAFWLASDDVGRPDMAHKVLKEAQCNIPFHYEVQLENGRVYLKEGHLRDAKHAFDAGLAFWPRPLTSDNPDARSDKAALLLYRGLLHEADGETDRAISSYEEIVSLFPERTPLLERAAALKKGEQPSILASKAWRASLSQDEKERKARHHQETTHDDHGDHDD
jgi:tetratricopeptide (TPR) repeat protein